LCDGSTLAPHMKKLLSHGHGPSKDHYFACLTKYTGGRMVRPFGCHALGVPMAKPGQDAINTILLPQRLAAGDREDSPWERLAMSCPPAGANHGSASISTRAAEEYIKALQDVPPPARPI
jgi:hypothetical protein